MEIVFWIGFIVLVMIFLIIDLGVFNKKLHDVSMKEATVWTLVWVSTALLFDVFIYFAYNNHWLNIGVGGPEPMEGAEAAGKFFTGWLIEKSLSMDNLFVMSVLFVYFKIPLRFQHRILFWGIVGALLLRGIMIIGGTSLINRFEWLTYVFGALLLFSAVKMITSNQENVDPYKNPVLKLIKKLFRVVDEYKDGNFFTRVDGKKAVTTLFVVLIVIETTDVMFAIDSIPAIFAVTTEPFIVFTSNIFAILGLRSLYFLLAAIMDRVRYLQTSLVFVIAFVGVKMLLVHVYKFPTLISLSVIIGMLAVGVIASVIAGNKDNAKLASPLDVPDAESDEQGIGKTERETLV